MIYEYRFITALFLSLIIEIPIVILLIYYYFKYKEITKLKILITAFLATTLTIPYLWFILPIFIQQRIYYILIGEILIFITEALIYIFILKLKNTHAFIISFISNITSFIFGIIFFK